MRLAGGASIPVDAKVPLDVYVEASALPAGDAHEAERRMLMRKHAKAVRSHIDALTKKAYWSGLDACPEFVICPPPSESLPSAALEGKASAVDDEPRTFSSPSTQSDA
ncbi:DNA recombination protein RmuC [Microbacterium sp. ZW T5_45]|uniref:DNA recombination protein RmuC n=1 Tax=Microbacterium sp. ZW T5_45 TaxID=3378080 RepID=UPI003854842C